VRAVPVILPFWAAFLEDEFAFGAEDVVSVAEVLVEEHCAGRNPLVAVFAVGFVGVGG
jgi:hypothetical protein